MCFQSVEKRKQIKWCSNRNNLKGKKTVGHPMMGLLSPMEEMVQQQVTAALHVFLLTKPRWDQTSLWNVSR